MKNASPYGSPAAFRRALTDKLKDLAATSRLRPRRRLRMSSGTVHFCAMICFACSGGTGTFIEKTARKLDIPLEQLSKMRYEGYTLHKISSKCGIFAETDANTLVKTGRASCRERV